MLVYKMKIISVLLIINWAVLNDAIITDSAWMEFKKNYGKEYRNTNEEFHRYKVFLENKKEITGHNEKFLQDATTFSMGINEYSDMTHEEFSSRILMKSRETPISDSMNYTSVTSEPLTALAAVDWRERGYVTPVKKQGDCGSCYAFSAVGGLEGQHFKKTHHLISLSEQNIVDCSSPQGNSGCDGGSLEESYTYVIKNHGIDTEKSYPYTGKEGSCHYTDKDKGATCTDFKTVKIGDEAYLRDAVSAHGPIPALIYAAKSFQQYKQGIYYEHDCPKNKLNHAVLIVGYGTEHDKDYWIVKNSWGTSWGEAGYAKMSRNRHNNCGIASNAVFPLIWGSAANLCLDQMCFFLALLNLLLISPWIANTT